MNRRKYLFLLVSLAIIIASMLNVLSVKAPASSSNVVAIPSYSNPHGGTLPNTGASDPLFTAFTFSTMPYASISAANLAPYDTVVLMISWLFLPATDLTASQISDLNTWLSNGGKLIIYDSEETPSVDYSWLPAGYGFTTKNPGAMGYPWLPAHNPVATFIEDNTLSSPDPLKPAYYIDAGKSEFYGDCNSFVAFDATKWCGDIECLNYYSDPNSPGYDSSPPSWVHTYARYNDGLIIYNGGDMNVIYQTTMTSTTGNGRFAKLWYLELAQPWNPDGLPCGVIPSFPEFGLSAMLVTSLGAVGYLLLKRRRLK